MRILILLLLVPSLAFASVPKDYGVNLVKEAEKYKYVREDLGPNRSNDIDLMLKELGLPKGLSWCLAYVQRVWKDYCTNNQVKNPMPKGVARVSLLLRKAESNPYQWKLKSAKSLMVGANNAKVGDMTIHITGKDVSAETNFNGHIGIIGALYNIDSNFVWEGNTGPEPQAVAKKLNIEQERNASGVTAGVHYRYRTYAPKSNFRIAYLIEAR